MVNLFASAVLVAMTAALLTGIVALKAVMLMVVTNWWAGSTVMGFWDAAVLVVIFQILFGSWNKGESR